MPVDYHGWTHRAKSLGGTDPLMGNPIAFFFNWEAEDDGLIVPDVWTNVGSAGIGSFNDGYVTKGASIGTNLGAGTISMPEGAFVQVNAWAQFFGDFDEGDVVAVGINGSPWGRIINAVTCDAAGVPGAEKIAVAMGAYSSSGGLDISMSVFHTNSGSMTLAGCELYVAYVQDVIPAGFITP